MLSYRHGFHAGNIADVCKHATLAIVTEYYTRKDSPFSYVDTHAGAGLYQLDTEWAEKTGEARGGILRLLDTALLGDEAARRDVPRALRPYLELCTQLYSETATYPGSPELVRRLSRPSDQLHLMELHSSEIEVLRSNMGSDARVHIHYRDAWTGATTLCPPNPRRGFALVDPSYETVEEYDAVVRLFDTLVSRWPAGGILLWYPLLTRREAERTQMLAALHTLAGTDWVQSELTIRAAETENGGFGMYGCGMFCLRPPWILADELEIVLDWLGPRLAQGSGAHWQVLRGEARA